jgi:hypothetical protein
MTPVKAAKIAVPDSRGIHAVVRVLGDFRGKENGP